MNNSHTYSWLDYIRENELEIILSNLRGRISGPALELGCGRGAQSQILSQNFKVFICSDLKDQRSYFNKDNFVVCDAQRLPFKNQTFNFIFSSNMLQYIELKDQCLSELKRVLKNRGLMVHTVPTFTWKLLFLFFHYPAMFKLVVNRIFSLNDAGSKQSNANRGVRSFKKSKINIFFHYLRVILYPMVHGTYRSNIDELLKYRKISWGSLFRKNGYVIRDIINLYFYSPYMFFKFKFLKLRRLFGKSSFTSCQAFVVTVE